MAPREGGGGGGGRGRIREKRRASGEWAVVMVGYERRGGRDIEAQKQRTAFHLKFSCTLGLGLGLDLVNYAATSVFDHGHKLP